MSLEKKSLGEWYLPKLGKKNPKRGVLKNSWPCQKLALLDLCLDPGTKIAIRGGGSFRRGQWCPETPCTDPQEDGVVMTILDVKSIHTGVSSKKKS